MTVAKLISGGQTGADRAALDFAISNDIPHGGWCPKGRLAMDGEIDGRYALKETPSRAYPERTEWNVRDSDATVVFTIAHKAKKGSALTIKSAAKQSKPCLQIHEGTPLEEVRTFLNLHSPAVLNVAGSREEEEPGIYIRVRAFLDRLWQLAAPPPQS